ncbi:DUF881 domain-containing protein [Alteribacter keqinensis]|uniref:DUF881 domain-containing protein n=1 Tax=Alteribacter keqinensis TaxID=2483800 RepID=A0A3M7TZ24_9BACI|nr:DUF881 domain-containing protein [Alteribacter keqinensis]RNA69685.1 DUF881 domain-containing protein [Alteribacter keqinensis]
MMKDRMMIFTVITTIIGFMVAVQFQTTKEPDVRDTRTVMELRQELTAEKEKQQELIEELATQEEMLEQLQNTGNVENVIEEAINGLKARAGLTEVSGEGVLIEIRPYFDENYQGGAIRTVPAHLVRMLINELNIYGAKDIAVGSQRIVSTTPIREVQGVTLINSRRMTTFPLQVRVLTDDPEQLHHYMMTSEVKEYLQYENLEFTSAPMTDITVPAYDQSMRVRYMAPVKEES